MWCRSSVTACSPDRDRLPCDGGLRESAGPLREGGSPRGRGRDRGIGDGLWHPRAVRWWGRREGEVRPRGDVLGHGLIDVETAHLIRAAALEREQRGDDWVLVGVDPRRRSRRLFGARLPAAPERGDHTFREWSKFEPLIGHTGSALLRGPFARIRRLKPAQIADLLEEASKEEETESLGPGHADPALQAGRLRE